MGVNRFVLNWSAEHPLSTRTRRSNFPITASQGKSANQKRESGKFLVFCIPYCVGQGTGGPLVPCPTEYGTRRFPALSCFLFHLDISPMKAFFKKALGHERRRVASPPPPSPYWILVTDWSQLWRFHIDYDEIARIAVLVERVRPRALWPHRAQLPPCALWRRR